MSNPLMSPSPSKVTPADVEDAIANVYFFTGTDGVYGRWGNSPRADAIRGGPPSADLHRITFCVLVMKNGHLVTGQSVCARIEDFDGDVGQTWARKAATDKVFDLLYYHRRSQPNVAGVSDA